MARYNKPQKPFGGHFKPTVQPAAPPPAQQEQFDLAQAWQNANQGRYNPMPQGAHAMGQPFAPPRPRYVPPQAPQAAPAQVQPVTDPYYATRGAVPPVAGAPGPRQANWGGQAAAAGQIQGQAAQPLSPQAQGMVDADVAEEQTMQQGRDRAALEQFTGQPWELPRVDTQYQIGQVQRQMAGGMTQSELDRGAQRYSFRDSDHMRRQYGIPKIRSDIDFAPGGHDSSQAFRDKQRAAEFGQMADNRDKRLAAEQEALTAQGYGQTQLAGESAPATPQGAPGSPERLAWAQGRAAQRKESPHDPSQIGTVAGRQKQAEAMKQASERMAARRPQYTPPTERQDAVRENAVARAKARQDRLQARRSGYRPTSPVDQSAMAMIGQILQLQGGMQQGQQVPAGLGQMITQWLQQQGNQKG